MPFTENDRDILDYLFQGDTRALNLLMERYYTGLCRFAVKHIRNEQEAEELVQDILVSLWDKRQILPAITSLPAYLYKAVKNRAINYLRAEMKKPEFEYDTSQVSVPIAAAVLEDMNVNELEKLVAIAIQKLPERCRIIFDLSRNAGLTYREIADELSISQKTVETQMTIALTRLKEYLKDHWEILALFPLLISTF